MEIENLLNKVRLGIVRNETSGEFKDFHGKVVGTWKVEDRLIK